MKEKAPREIQGVRKAAAVQAAQREAREKAEAGALAGSPVLDAQRKRMEQLDLAQAASRRVRPVQRVKDCPDFKMLRKYTNRCRDNRAGSCAGRSGELFGMLQNPMHCTGLSKDDLRILWLTWTVPVQSEKGGQERTHVDHYAVQVNWSGGVVVLDPTAEQFGLNGFLLKESAEGWQEAILATQAGYGDVVLQVQTRPGGAARNTLSAGVLGTGYAPSRSARNADSHEMVLADDEYAHGRSDEGERTATEYSDHDSYDGELTNDEYADGVSHARTPTSDVHEQDAAPRRRRRGWRRRCFLTSACVDFHGMPDDCHELEVLRAYRDGWLTAQTGGPALIDEYYETAPAIVDAIEVAPARAQIYARILATVRGCVAHIEHGRPHAARAVYIDLVRGLQSELLPVPPLHA